MSLICQINLPSFSQSKQSFCRGRYLPLTKRSSFRSLAYPPIPWPLWCVNLLPPSSIFQQTFNTHTKLKPLTHYQINCSYLKLCNKKLNKITSTHCLKKFLKPSKCVPEWILTWSNCVFYMGRIRDCAHASIYEKCISTGEWNTILCV